ncbi:MAG: hypothetical protein ACJAUP_002994 [Cellvibrionaceae bacterium]|jgi:hypothetical protein
MKIKIKLSGLAVTTTLMLIIAVTMSLFSCGADEKALQLGAERAANNEADVTEGMIGAIKAASLKKYPSGLIKRFNQSKTLGCFEASMTVAKNLPDELRQGIFSKETTYSAKIRFSNATKQDDTKKDFRGMSIKLSGIEGPSIWGEDGEQDFTLNSYPALFAANPDDFLEFIGATGDDKRWRYFIRPSHFYSLKIALKGREKINNPFAIRYWSTTPYRLGLGKGKAVKYSAQSCSNFSENVNVKKSESFLSEVMAEQLKRTSACFEFMVQIQKDPNTMPIENAAVIWDEEQSPFIKVAEITIEDQNFTSTEELKACESISFNPWQSIEEHRPIGGINRVRRAVYSEIADFRRDENARRGLR